MTSHFSDYGIDWNDLVTLMLRTLIANAKEVDVVSKEFMDIPGQKKQSAITCRKPRKEVLLIDTYDNGYVLDIGLQTARLAARIRTARETEVSCEEIDDTN